MKRRSFLQVLAGLFTAPVIPDVLGNDLKVALFTSAGEEVKSFDFDEYFSDEALTERFENVEVKSVEVTFSEDKCTAVYMNYKHEALYGLEIPGPPYRI